MLQRPCLLLNSESNCQRNLSWIFERKNLELDANYNGYVEHLSDFFEW